jgi:hypothetical protein
VRKRSRHATIGAAIAPAALSAIATDGTRGAAADGGALTGSTGTTSGTDAATTSTGSAAALWAAVRGLPGK